MKEINVFAQRKDNNEVFSLCHLILYANDRFELEKVYLIQ